MKKLKHFFRAVVFDFRARRAIRKAQRDANLHRRKHRFGKGFTAEKARSVAMFEAVPQPLPKRECRRCFLNFRKRDVSKR